MPVERLAMVSFRDLRIRTKLTVGFGAVIVVLATIATIGALATMSVRDSAETALDRDARLNAIALELQVHVTNAQNAAAAFRFDATRGRARATADGAERTVAGEINAARALVAEARPLTRTQAAELDLIAAKLDEFEAQFKQVQESIRQRESVGADGVALFADVGFESVSGAVAAAAGRLGAAGKAATSAARSDISDTSVAAVRTVAVVSAIGVLMAALLVIVLSRTITGPLGNLADVSNRMSLGELDVHIGVHSKDEVGQLADSLRRMQASLRAAIERLRARRAA